MRPSGTAQGLPHTPHLMPPAYGVANTMLRGLGARGLWDGRTTARWKPRRVRHKGRTWLQENESSTEAEIGQQAALNQDAIHVGS